jgi:hypothetical protein
MGSLLRALTIEFGNISDWTLFAESSDCHERADRRSKIADTVAVGRCALSYLVSPKGAYSREMVRQLRRSDRSRRARNALDLEAYALDDRDLSGKANLVSRSRGVRVAVKEGQATR